MNDKQLAILVTAWANRLEREIEAVRAQLPGDLPRLQERVFVGNVVDYTIGQNDPSNWENRDGDFAILDGLNRLHQELTAAAESLNSGCATTAQD